MHRCSREHICRLVGGQFTQVTHHGKAHDAAKTKTYSSRDSLLVTHAITNLPIHSLDMTEQTGSLAFCDLWLYVKVG
jgi:hypothetical protein